MQNVFSIDGRYFDVVIPEQGIKRSFSVMDSDKAGRVLTGRMMRDIIGTFYNYTIEFKANKLNRKEYDELYGIISDPDVDYHTITVPYGQTSITFDAYITNGQDVVDRIGKDGTKWSGLSVNFIAMEPLRTPQGVI